MTPCADDYVAAAMTALAAGDREAGSRAYECTGACVREDRPEEAAQLLLMAAMHETGDPGRRDQLQEDAQLLFHDAANLDRTSEVAFARAGDAMASGQIDRARALYVASIALAGAHLAEHAYRALTAKRDAIELAELGDRIRHAARALSDQAPN